MYSVKRADISLIILEFALSIKIVFLLTLEFTSGIVDLFFYLSFFSSLLIIKKYSYQQITLVILSLIYTLIFFSSERRNLFLLFLICIFIINSCNFRNSLRITIFFSFFTIFIVNIFILLGFAKNLYFIDFDKSIYYTFGFKNPNTFALFFYGILVCLLVLYRNLLGKMLDFIALLTVIFIYKKTGCSTLIISFFALYIIYIFLKKKHGKIVKVLCVILPIFLVVLLIYLSLNVNNFRCVDIFLTGRITLYNRLFLHSNLLDICFGNSKVISSNSIILDNGYFMLLFSGGVISLVIFFILYTKFVENCFVKKKYFLLSIVISYLFYGVMESVFTQVILFSNLVFWLIILQHSETNQ